MTHRDHHEEVDLFAVLRILVAHSRMILRNVAVAIVVLVLLVLVWPPTYTAKTTLLPPVSSDHESFINLLAETPLASLAIPRPRSSSDLFAEILHSRAVGEIVLHTDLGIADVPPDLLAQWEMTSEEKAIKKLYQRTTISTTEQGIIEIAVAMRSPQQAAAVANAFVAALDSVNQQKGISAARNARLYLESQLQTTSMEMNHLADSLAGFQARYGAVGLSEQMQAVLEKAAELKGKIIAAEVEIEIMRLNMKPGNAVLLQKQAELRALQRQYQTLQFGSSESNSDDLLVPVREVPQLARQLAELTRELKVQETVWSLLNQQYYQARIQEARDIPTVQVLDIAKPPEFRSHPKRLLTILVGASIVLILSVIAAFVLHYIDGLQQDETERMKWRGVLSVFNDRVRSNRRRLQDQTHEES